MTEIDLLDSTKTPDLNSSTPKAECPQEVHDSEMIHWYVMRSAYGREMKAKQLLEDDAIECYVPVQKKKVKKNNEVVSQEVPVVRNLVFVRTTRKIMDPWKQTHEIGASLRYTIDKSRRKPMIVSDKAMDDFIRVTRDASDSILYLDNPDVAIAKGQRVEVVVGEFKGVQGHILRIRRDRRIVVSLDGVIAVAMASMPRDHFRLIND